jgi:hypothetical protein
MLPLLLALAAPPEASDDLRALVQRVVPRVEEIRGHKFARPVEVKLADADAVRAHFERRVAQELEPEKVAREQTAMTQLGLLPPGTDLLALVSSFLQDAVEGFYDPETKTFYLRTHLDPTAAAVVTAHELTHALDDQLHDLDALQKAAGDDDDRAAAVHALIEGSGTAVMVSYVLQEVGSGRLSAEAFQKMAAQEQDRSARLGQVPPLVTRSLVAPYVLGSSFLVRGQPMRMALGVNVADLDQAFREPPVSTEQILHPEKYWERNPRETPRLPVALPDLSPRLGAGFARTAGGSLGELLLAVLAGLPTPALNSVQANDAASWTGPAVAGAAGDRWELYANGSRSVTALTTLWDSGPDALEFQQALRLPKGARSFRCGAAVLVLAGDLPADGTEPAAALGLQPVCQG